MVPGALRRRWLGGGDGSDADAGAGAGAAGRRRFVVQDALRVVALRRLHFGAVRHGAGRRRQRRGRPIARASGR